MSQTLVQSVAAELVVVLTKDNVPVTGLAFGDVTVALRKENGSFVAKTLSGANWTELGDGVYAIDATTTDTNTAGSLTVKVQGADIDQFVVVDRVIAAASGGASVTLDTCVLTGHVATAAGVPVEGATVTARIMGRPSIEQAAAALTDDAVVAQTDGAGEFFLTLVRLADVEIFIPEANYRRRITVPNVATADLFSEVVA